MNQENIDAGRPNIFEITESWVDRNGFAHWVVALVWVFAALVLFQIVGGIIGAILLLPEIIQVMGSSADPSALQGDLQSIFAENLGKVFIGNSAGQFLIIGLGSYLVAKLHSVKGQTRNYIRLKTSPNVWLITLLTAVLVIAVMPFNGFLGWTNTVLFDRMTNVFPGLNWFIDMQDSMADMIKGFIGADNAMLLAFIHIGIVPAVFEEIMFRGYVLRSFEKSWGIIAAILVSGLLFGMYHIQPSNLIPLSLLGIIFAFVTYVSDSLIPAMVAHLINNGSQVIYGSMNPEFLDQEMGTEFDMSVILIIGSLLLSVGLIYAMMKTKNNEVSHV